MGADENQRGSCTNNAIKCSPRSYFPFCYFVINKISKTSYYFINHRMNIKESCTPTLEKPKISICTRSSETDSVSQEDKLQLSKTQFCIWARSLPTQQRFLALRMKMPSLIQSFRMHTRQFGENWRYQQNEGKKQSGRLGKNILSVYQSFIDSIVLMTETDYSDCVGFQFSFVESPERIYDLLVSIRNISNKTALDKINQIRPNKPRQKKYISKSEWIHEAASQIQIQLAEKMKSKWDPKILDLEKTQKREFGNFWKNLTEEARLTFLYLGAQDFKQLIINLVDMKIPIRPNQLQIQIGNLLKIEKKDFCNKLFKWKLKRTSYFLFDYLEILFEKIRQAIPNRSIGKVKKNRRKRKNNNKRMKSVDACSNETNQTQIKQQKTQCEEKQVDQRLQNQFLNCVDKISEQANSYFQNRVLGFERLAYILDMFGIKVKLYGSCACGIAIKNSDLDIALSEEVLDSFEYLSSTHAKIQACFEILQTHFNKFCWIQIVKTIPTAYIPIIKLKIDNSIPFTMQGTSKQFFTHLNRNVKNSGPVQIDLTIQTSRQKSDLIHLGIISTKKSLVWMEQIPSLRYIVILLKNVLSNKGLNQTYYGGINTYTLMIMVVSFIYHSGLQQQKVNSKVFGYFLRFYGWDFDEKEYLIDLRGYQCTDGGGKEIFQKKGQKKEKMGHNAADLQILDPLNDGKIMTKNCYKFCEIKHIFRQIYEQFFEPNKILSKQEIDQDKKIEIQEKTSKQTKRNHFVQWMCQ